MEKPVRHRGIAWDFLWEGLWTEGLRVFFSYWRGWILGALLLTALTSLCGYAADRSGYQLFWSLLNSVAVATIFYFFCICFLNQEPVTGIVRPGWKSYVFALIYFHLIVFIFAGFYLLISHAAGELRASHPTQASLIAMMLAKWMCLAIIIYGCMRTLFVVPLTINNIASPLKKSLALTRNKAGRLFVNFLVVTVLAAPLLMLGMLHNPVVDHAVQVIACGVQSALICVACRVMYGENIAANVGERRGAQRA